MSPKEQDRERIRRVLAEQLSPDVADLLLEHIPPFPWDQVARQDDLVAMRSDMVAMRSDMEDLRTDVDHLRTDVDHLRTDVDHLRTDVDELKVDVRIIRETLDLRFESLGNEVSARFHADLLAHARVMFFSMVGAVFTSASLAFAAVRL